MRCWRPSPISTRQVLYPEDLDPVEFIGLPLDELALPGCELGHQNVAGLVTMQVLFHEHGELDAVQEFLPRWRGDRFVHASCSDGWEFLWFTRWDDADTARQFAEAFRGVASRLAQRLPYRGPLRAVVSGRSALVLTPGFEAELPALLAQTEIREFYDLAGWLEADCFPESPCPRAALLSSEPDVRP